MHEFPTALVQRGPLEGGIEGSCGPVGPTCPGQRVVGRSPPAPIDDEWADSVGCAANALASPAVAASISATPITVARSAPSSSLLLAARGAKGRVLTRGPSDEMSQPVTKKGAAANQLANEYIKDQRVVIGFLASRPELQNLTALVVDFVASTQRWRVALDTGEIIAVKREALRQFTFGPVA